MVKTTIVCLAGVTALLTTAFQTKPDQTVDRVYEGNGAKVTGVGVCDISTEKISCWNMDGDPDAALTSTVTGSLMGGNYGGEVSFRFGKKNRWLVTDVTGTTNVNVQSLDGYGGGMQVSRQGDKVLQLTRITADPSEKTSGVIANFYNLPGPAPIEIPFHEGSKASYGGIDFEIGPAKEWKPTAQELQRFNNYGTEAKGKYWKIVFGYARPTGTSTPYPSFTVLGKDGKPIHYVDKNGDPVSDLKVLSELPDDASNGPRFYPGNNLPNSKYPAATFTLDNQPGLDAANAFSNVNPSQIGSIRVSGTFQFRVQVNGYPLDPK